jgi:membrane-bound serine protease (ClpP class)
MAWLVAAFVLSLFVMAFLASYVAPNLKVFDRFVQKGEEDASEGFVAGPSAAELPPIGSKGTAATTLRPAGKVLVDGILYDGASVGRFIEKDTPIVIANIEGSHVVVDVAMKADDNG